MTNDRREKVDAVEMTDQVNGPSGYNVWTGAGRQTARSACNAETDTDRFGFPTSLRHSSQDNIYNLDEPVS